jgi:tRNA(Ile)-lysidine synthase TilS/MesJ
MTSKAIKSALNFDFESMMYVLSFKNPQDNISLHKKLLNSVKDYDGYSVALSGGYDSQFVCLVLKEAGVKFNAISYRLFWKDEIVNANDVLACAEFCKKHNIDIEFIDIDGYKFFNDGIFAITGK